MYHLTEVKTDVEEREFLRLPVRLYKNDPNWIRPIDSDIQNIFDPSKNKAFRNGECIRWILKDDEEKTVGRVAAFFDLKSARNNDQPTGGMGFFECINDPQAAFMLFDACKNWLESREMEAMDGPVNFGERDSWWGLLVDGFLPPNYTNPYNFPYYKKFFEDYGFQNYFDQYTYFRNISREGLKPELIEKANRVFQNPSYEFRFLKRKEIKKYAEDFTIIYNKAWARFPGVKKFTTAHVMTLMQKIKSFMDERLLLFAYYNNEPIGFFLMHPEINQILKHVNGKLDWLGKLKFWYLLKTRHCTKVIGMIFGVVPEHHAKGIEAAMIMKFAEIAWKPNFPYKTLELNWIGDFNPSMMKVAEQIGASILKTHVTYRYLFDRTKEFKRARLVNRPEKE